MQNKVCYITMELSLLYNDLIQQFHSIIIHGEPKSRLSPKSISQSAMGDDKVFTTGCRQCNCTFFSSLSCISSLTRGDTMSWGGMNISSLHVSPPAASPCLHTSSPHPLQPSDTSSPDNISSSSSSPAYTSWSAFSWSQTWGSSAAPDDRLDASPRPSCVSRLSRICFQIWNKNIL